MAPPTPLPTLPTAPTSHPDSCLTLSPHLITTLRSLAPHSNRKILSIGSGTGLLEALLSSSKSGDQTLNISVHGVEPTPGSANRYLHHSQLHLVSGTWAVLPSATVCEYGMWMFVYPREKGLVGRYLDLLCGLRGLEKPRGLQGSQSCFMGLEPEMGGCQMQYPMQMQRQIQGLELGSGSGLSQIVSGRMSQSHSQSRSHKDRNGNGNRGGYGIDARQKDGCGSGRRGAGVGNLVLVWAGPKADWDDFEGEFRREGIVLRESLEGSRGGVADWEMVVCFDWVGGVPSHTRIDDDEQVTACGVNIGEI